MLATLFFALFGGAPQLAQIERYIDQCEAEYIKHSGGGIPTEADTISVWVGKQVSSVAFTLGHYGEITGVPSQEYGQRAACGIVNNSLEVYWLLQTAKKVYFDNSDVHPDLVPDLESEFIVIQYAITATGRKYLGAKRFSQRGLSLHVYRVKPDEVILNGYHTQPHLTWPELPPVHGGLELPMVEATRYQDNGDGTVTDKTTGLMWQRCAWGRQWREGRCEGEALVVPYLEAEVQVKWANHNSVAGFNDWRLPRVEELAGLVYCSSGQRNRIYPSGYGGECQGDYQVPTLLLEAFDKEVAWGGKQLMPFWSSSLFRNDDDVYWTVFFDTGFIAETYGNLQHTSAIRLVREVQ